MCIRDSAFIGFLCCLLFFSLREGGLTVHVYIYAPEGEVRSVHHNGTTASTQHEQQQSFLRFETTKPRDEKKDEAPVTAATETSAKTAAAAAAAAVATSDPTTQAAEAPKPSQTTPAAALTTTTNTGDDVYNHNMTMDDYYHLPKHSKPSHAWLTQCAQDVALDDSIVKPFPTGRPDYMLGDCLRYCWMCDSGQWRNGRGKRKIKIGNDTMATLYKRQVCDQGKLGYKTIQRKGKIFHGAENFTLHMADVATIFEDFEKRPYFTPLKPDPQAFVLHLRLGDVVDAGNQPNSADGLLKFGGIGHHPETLEQKVTSIRSFDEYYETMEAVFQKESVKEKKVIMVGGSHKEQFYKKSRVYATCLHRGFAKAGYKVEVYFDRGDPDLDFYYMCHAKKYIPSSGGFSLMIGNMVHHFGGHIYGKAVHKTQHVPVE